MTTPIAPARAGIALPLRRNLRVGRSRRRAGEPAAGFAFARRYAYRTRNGRVGPSRRHLQRQLQLCPRRCEPGAEPARRLSARQGAAVRVYSPITQDARLPADRGSDRPARASRFPGGRNIGSASPSRRGCASDLRAFRPNIFHVASPEITGHRAVSLAHRWDLPVIASVHTRFETYPRYYGLAFLEPLVLAGLRRFYRRCDAIFAPSEFDGAAAARPADELRRRHLVARHRPRDLQSRRARSRLAALPRHRGRRCR